MIFFFVLDTFSYHNFHSPYYALELFCAVSMNFQASTSLNIVKLFQIKYSVKENELHRLENIWITFNDRI